MKNIKALLLEKPWWRTENEFNSGKIAGLERIEEIGRISFQRKFFSESIIIIFIPGNLLYEIYSNFLTELLILNHLTSGICLLLFLTAILQYILQQIDRIWKDRLAVHRVTKKNNEWQRVVQRVTRSGITSDSEWQQMTADDK